MTRRSKRLLVALSVAAGILAAAAAGVAAIGPGWLRGFIERTASRALGRELKIAGAFGLSLSLTPTLTASDISLANARWGSEPSMVRAGRITIAVDPASLWSGPLTIRSVEIDDVHVLLEADGQGHGNWMFDLEAAPARKAGTTTRPPPVIERAAINGFELVYLARPGARPVEVGIEDLDAGLDTATRMIDVHASGHFNNSPWDLFGRLGRLESLYAGRDLDQTLAGHIGQATLTLAGRIRDPFTLGGPNLDVTVDGPEVVTALAVFGLTSPLRGPFRLEGRFAPSEDAVGVELSGTLGGVSASAHGSVNALLSPVHIDARVEARGPDAAVIGSWTGVPGLPPRPFDLAGRVRRDDRRLSLDDLRLKVGDTSLVVDGTLGELPRCVGTELTVSATGSELSQLSELTTVRLPSGRFDVRGRFLRRADGLAIEGAEVHVGGATIHAAGTIGQPPRCANLDLTAEGSGPDASILSGIATIELPAEPFEIRGRVARHGAAVGLDGIVGRLGDDAFEGDAQLVPVRGLAGTSARVHLTGLDLAKSAALAGVHGLPAQPFAVDGRVDVTPDAYELTGIEARVGSLTESVDGRVAAPSPLDGTSLMVRLRGAALSDLAAWGLPAKLPPDAFTASGRVSIDAGVYRVEGAVAEIGADRLEVDGTLGALPDASALDVGVTASGPDLAALGRFFVAAGVDPPKRVPAEPFTLAGRVRRKTPGLEIEGMRAEVGDLTLSADGTVGTGERGLGTDLRFTAKAPDTSVLSQALGATLPDGALQAHGRIERIENGLRLEGVAVSIGASYAEASGLLGDPPNFTGTALDVSAEGPDLAAVLDPWLGQTPVPEDSFEVSAHFQGGSDRFTADPFTARLGDSDLAGSVSMHLEDRPFVEADLRSKRLDVPRLLRGFTREPDAASDASPEPPAKKDRNKRDHVIPDQPLPLSGLGRFDAHLQLAAVEVQFEGLSIRDVDIAGELRDGALSFDRTAGTGKSGGRLSSSLSLRPDVAGYRLHAEGRLEGGRLDVTKTGESAELAPSLDIEYEVNGVGRSLHEIAASADGRALVVLGSGRLPNDMFGKGSATMISLLDALNPFRKSSPYTALECGVAVAGIDDGKMAVQPIAARTDKLTMVGKGKLDFDTEHIDLSWTIKPRRNIGISAGSIANPYIKLGGTLAAPRLDVKPIEAAASTGAAVATAGLTILFRSIYNRITAEKKVCVDAIEKAQKQREKRDAKKGEPAPE